MRFTLGIILGAIVAVITAPFNSVGDLMDRLSRVRCSQCHRRTSQRELTIATFTSFKGKKRSKFLCPDCARRLLDKRAI